MSLKSSSTDPSTLFCCCGDVKFVSVLNYPELDNHHSRLEIGNDSILREYSSARFSRVVSVPTTDSRRVIATCGTLGPSHEPHLRVDDQLILVYDIDSRALIPIYGYGSRIMALTATSPSGYMGTSLLVSGGLSDHQIVVTDSCTGRHIDYLRRPGECRKPYLTRLLSVFEWNHRIFAAGACLEDFDLLRCVKLESYGHPSEGPYRIIRAVAACSQRDCILTVHANKTVRLWNVGERKSVRCGALSSYGLSCCFADENLFVVGLDSVPGIEIWDVRNMRERVELFQTERLEGCIHVEESIQVETGLVAFGGYKSVTLLRPSRVKRSLSQSRVRTCRKQDDWSIVWGVCVVSLEADHLTIDRTLGAERIGFLLEQSGSCYVEVGCSSSCSVTLRCWKWIFWNS